MKEELPASGDWWKLTNGETCPTCLGERLNPSGRNVFLQDKDNRSLSLPKLLALTPEEISGFLQNLKIQKEKLKAKKYIIVEMKVTIIIFMFVLFLKIKKYKIHVITELNKKSGGPKSRAQLVFVSDLHFLGGERSQKWSF